LCEYLWVAGEVLSLFDKELLFLRQIVNAIVSHQLNKLLTQMCLGTLLVYLQFKGPLLLVANGVDKGLHILVFDELKWIMHQNIY
jgi:hypothetical protein